jgi:DNA mismatch repair protein MSH2
LTFRIFEHQNGDFYSFHGKDIAAAQKTSVKSSIVVKTMAPDELPSLIYSSVNKINYEKLLKELLLVIGYKVEVYIKSKGKDEWNLQYKGSPGNLTQFEDILFNSLEPEVINNLLISIQLHQKKLGIAAINVTEHSIHVAEIEDSSFFNELESILVLLSPKECIVPSSAGDYEKIKEIVERNRILVTVQKKSDFSANTTFHQDLEKLLRFKKGQKKSVHTVPEIKLELAMGSLAAGIKYLEVINEEGNIGKFSIQTLNLSRFVHLDGAAVSALNLFPPPEINYRSSLYKWQSVLGVLDRCKTNQGRRMLSQWIKQPLRSLEQIRERHDVVESLVNNQEIRNLMHKEHLSSIPDVLMLNNKMLRKRAGLQDLFKIYQVILRIPEILKLLKLLENRAVDATVLDRFSEALQDLKKFEELVEEVLDLESVENGEYLIKAEFDENLNEVRKEMNQIEAKMKKELKKICELLNVDEGSSIKLDYASHLGHHFRTTRKEDQKLRQHKQFSIIDTARNGIRFTNDKLKSYNEDYAELRGTYEEKQKEIVQEMVRIASGYSGPLHNLNFAIALLDVFVSLAEVATNSPAVYVRPKMYDVNEKRILKFDALRHPCLEYQDDLHFIPNDLEMKEGENNMNIITGANISGKSTYIRSIGCAVLMAHIGSFVPCDEAHIPVFDAIFTRVGANDNLQKGLSTFMVEMVETSSILATATKNSLVIIDELGRGTSTFEGLGLAWSIAEHLVKEIQCFTLFATHFHEITDLADGKVKAKNFHLKAITEDGKLTLLFKVSPGPVSKSFGIKVAEIAKLPAEVLNDAKSFLQEIENEQSRDKGIDLKINEFLDKIEKGIDYDISEIMSVV